MKSCRDFLSGIKPTMRPSDLDFITFDSTHDISETPSDPIQKQFNDRLDRYQAILNLNESFIRHSDHDPYALFSVTFETNLRKAFHNRGPCLATEQSERNRPYSSLSWVDIAHNVREGDLVRHSDDTYRCSCRGQTVQLTEDEKALIIPAQALLGLWPPPADMVKEHKAGQGVARELDQYERQLKATLDRIAAMKLQVGERNSMIHCYLQSVFEPPQPSRVENTSLPSRQRSPTNSIVNDNRGDIEYADSTEDSTDDSSDDSSDEGLDEDEDMETQGAPNETAEVPGTNNVSDLQIPQRQGDFREADIVILDAPDSDDHPQVSGLPATETLESAAATRDGEDADGGSITNTGSSRRGRRPAYPKTDEEAEQGYAFIMNLRRLKVSWDEITDQYNWRFGVNRSKAGLRSLLHRWKAEQGATRRANTSRRGGRMSRAYRNRRSGRQSMTGSEQGQSSIETPQQEQVPQESLESRSAVS